MEPEESDASGEDTLRVIIVDDNVDFADSLAAILRFNGHDVRATYGGIHALAMAATFRPHVGLLDIGMPGVNGYDLAKGLRKIPATKDMLLIAITGYGSTEHRHQSRQAGFDHHLVKTAELDVIDRLLLQHRSQG